MEQKELENQKAQSQRIFYRKNKGVNGKRALMQQPAQHNLKKFFGVPKAPMDIRMGFTDEACSTPSDDNQIPEEEK